MKSICIILVGLLISFAGTAQTKRIAQRSHSGSSENLVVASDDNFGLSPKTIRRMNKELRDEKAKKDSTDAKAAKDSVEKAAAKKSIKSKKGKTKPIV